MTTVLHWDMNHVAGENTNFRKVLWTGEHQQLAVMTIEPGGEVGMEVHEHYDQVVSIVSGSGRAFVDDRDRFVGAGDVVAVPATMKHNFVNVGPNPLTFFTVYGPPRHAIGIVHETKRDSDYDDQHRLDRPPAKTGEKFDPRVEDEERR